MLDYLIRIGDAISQTLNVILFNGNPNESISARSYREKWILESWIDFILGKDHCKNAYEADLAYSSKLLTTKVQEN